MTDMLLFLFPYLCVVAPLFIMCCCEEGCTIVSDTFSSDTIANWTQNSGSWSIVSGELTTSDDNALITHNTAGSTGHGTVEAEGEVSENGTSWRVRGSVVDDDNYLFAEVMINGASSTFKLWKRVSGTDTQLGATFTFTGAVDTPNTAKVCWNGSHASAALEGTLRSVGAYTGTGNKAGLGASAGAGTAKFNSFTFSKNITDDSDCPACGSGCPTVCSNEPVPISVTFGGIANSTCIGCAGFNATFVVPTRTGACNYGGSTSGLATCGVLSVGATISIVFSTSGGNTRVVANFSMNDFLTCSNIVQFFNSNIGPSPVNCAGLESQDVPLNTLTSNTCCDLSSATCILDAA